MAGISPWEYAKASEHSHQAALFMWANMACRFGLYTSNFPAAYKEAGWAAAYSKDAIATGNDILVPQLKWLHAIHNQGREAGEAGKIRGANAKAEGVKAGVWDMFLPVPTTYAGFYLELKVGKNTTSPVQNEFGEDMRAVGYATEVAWGWLEARNKLLAYLGLPLYPD